MLPILTLTLTVLLPLAAALQMDLSPRAALFQVGDRQELKCSMSECPEDVSFSWISLEDKPLYAQSKFSSKESVLIYNSVTKEHENEIQCRAWCKDVSKQAKAIIKVYSFAEDPVISNHDHLELAKENTLICEVSGVYPSENVKVEWLRGGNVLYTEEGKLDKKIVQSSYTFTPQKEDDGEQITCRASLELDDLPADQSTRETTVSMTVTSAPLSVEVFGSSTVPVGSVLSLACAADGNPEPMFSWRVLRPAGQWVKVAETRELSLINVSLADAGDYECEASNVMGKTTATVTVNIHGPPTNTVIAVSHSEPREGELVSVSCVSDGVPQSRLVLSKLQDGVETQLLSGPGPQISVHFYSVNISDTGLYVCEAYNDHGRQKASVQLSVQSNPLEVSLQGNMSVTSVERGSTLLLTCKASGCPNPHFTWKGLEDKSVQRQNHTQTAVSQLNLGPVEVKDGGVFICEVKCGSVVKSSSTEVRIFSFPSNPEIERSGPPVEGEVMNLTCTVHDVFPGNSFHMVWLDGETEVYSETWPFANGLQNLSSVFSYRVPSRTDREKIITCRVLRELDDVPGQFEEKTASTTLAVHYAPRQAAITVSPQGELKAGESVSISCRTDSAPEGLVVLRKVLEGTETELASSEGSQTSFTIPSTELSDSGLYVCEAVNQHGSQRSSVQITVKAPPRNTTVKVFPSTQVQEGQNITICCHSVSYPPPAIILRKMDGGIDIYSSNGTFQLVNLTPNDTGLYQINVTNNLGYETEVFSIHVLERLSSPQPGWNIIIAPLTGLGLLASATIVLEHLKRARRKGSYELSKCSQGTV